MSEPASRRGRIVGRATVRRFVGIAKPRPAPRQPAQPRPAQPPTAGAAAPTTGVARGKAVPVDPSTRPIPALDVTGPVFVDHSGRRARALRRIVYCVVVLALVLLALLWLSQASVIGVEVP